jgi:hypothetical protein
MIAKALIVTVAIFASGSLFFSRTERTIVDRV